jgi:chromosome partitioning protein
MLDWLKRIAIPVPRGHLVESENQSPPKGELVERLLDRLENPGRITNGAETEAAQMRVIVVASQKGGVGKTTIAAHLAVSAGIAGQGPAVLVDTDPQKSLTEWWEARRAEQATDDEGNNEDTPALVTVQLDHLDAKLIELRQQGAALVIIDTPPALTTSIDKVIQIADLVIIPARPSPHDLRAIGATVNLTRRAKKPYLFIVNGAAPRANITAEAVAALSEHGRVAPVILYQRTDYAASMIDGRTVMETGGPTGRSMQEVAALWSHIYGQMNIRTAA